ncbi:hypothetical protein ABGV43_27385 [Paenibacillus amylolyticus]|uniref:hypothetical protein n=1 Tax=Paenibacillus amylolyticus TaxID=1451 RepID=UPI003242B061
MKHIRKMVVAVLVSAAVIILIYNFTSQNEERFVKANESRITPSTTLTVINNEEFAGTANMHRFDIPAGSALVRVSFKNTGSKHFTFTLNKGSTSGTEITFGSVPADGKEHTYYSDKALSTGGYYVNTSSAQGMSGTLDVSLETNAN